MSLLRELRNRSAALLRKLRGVRTGPVPKITDRDLERLLMPVATTRPVWLRFCQSAAQASTVVGIVAMHRSVEMCVARMAGVSLTVQQLREAAVYSVTYDEESDRHVYEVFAPFGITYQPAAVLR